MWRVDKEGFGGGDVGPRRVTGAEACNDLGRVCGLAEAVPFLQSSAPTTKLGARGVFGYGLGAVGD